MVAFAPRSGSHRLGRRHSLMRDPRAIVAMIIAACVGAAIPLAIGGLIFRDRSLTDNGGEALIALGGALVGGLVSWLTMNHMSKDPEK